MTMDERLAYIERVLVKYMPKDAGPANRVREAMEYALMAGGKRIRPMLMMLTYEAFITKKNEEMHQLAEKKDKKEKKAKNSLPDAVAETDRTEILTAPVSREGVRGLEWKPEETQALPREVLECYMAALEMIHTFSLIHDDLPAMDNDTLRRGKPTVHVAYGEDIAILAGDGLENLAFEVASQAFELAPENRRVETALRILARRPGLYGMLGGQTADVTLSGKKLTDEQLEYIYANKTAALLECAMEIGSVLGGASAAETEKIRRIAYYVGIAFQVQDDILDETGDAATLGKEVGQDARNEKTTYVTLHGMEAAKAYVQQCTDQAAKLLEELFAMKKKGQNDAAAVLAGLLQSLVGRRS